MPVGVHVAVVDPGVGTERRPVVMRGDRGDLFVGPDNGLLHAGGRRARRRAGGWVIENRDLMPADGVPTFHGRDLFAPVAAHLAAA